jgi:hypothetical protein
MKKIFSILFILLFSTSVFAKQKLYTCKNKFDVYSCTGSCKKDNNVEIEFKIDKTKNLVFSSMFLENKFVGDTSLENCKVIDDKNWICEDTSVYNLNPKLPFLTDYRVQGMKEGGYYQYSESTSSPANYYEFMSGSCSKKRFF